MAELQTLDVNMDAHPIDVVETLAQHHEWDFERTAEDQISLAIEGQWKTYSVTLAWSGVDDTLRLFCTYSMDPPADKMARLYEALNVANDKCWLGGFSFWTGTSIMAYRYSIMLVDGMPPEATQIDQMLSCALSACERFYPAFQLVSWTDTPVDEAMGIAMSHAHGSA